MAIALLTQAVTDLPSAFAGDPATVVKFWLQVSLAGLITWRAYIDRSPAEVNADKPDKVIVTNTERNPIPTEPVAQTEEKV